MGIRIPLLLLVFGRTWRLNDSGIHDCPLLEDQPPVGQGFYYESKELFMNVVVYEQVAESADGVAIRNLIAGSHTAEIRKSPAVDDLISSAFVGQVVEILQKMNPQHQLQVVGLISALSLIVARSDQLLQLSPRHDSFDLFQKFFLMRFDFFQFVAKKRQIYLFVHTLILPLFCNLFYCFVFVRCCLNDLKRINLVCFRIANIGFAQSCGLDGINHGEFETGLVQETNQVFGKVLG